MSKQSEHTGITPGPSSCQTLPPLSQQRHQHSFGLSHLDRLPLMVIQRSLRMLEAFSIVLTFQDFSQNMPKWLSRVCMFALYIVTIQHVGNACLDGITHTFVHHFK